MYYFLFIYNRIVSITTILLYFYHTCLTFKIQDSIDRAEMIAGIELGRELINAAMINPSGIDQKKMMEDIQSLMTPKRYKDLSPIDLQKMAFDKYVENASIHMAKNINENVYQVQIPKQHASIGGSLVKHWISKGYEVTTSEWCNPCWDPINPTANTDGGMGTITLKW